MPDTSFSRSVMPDPHFRCRGALNHAADRMSKRLDIAGDDLEVVALLDKPAGRGRQPAREPAIGQQALGGGREILGPLGDQQMAPVDDRESLRAGSRGDDGPAVSEGLENLDATAAAGANGYNRDRRG